MAASTSPSPKLGKTTALTKAQATVARLAAIVPTLSTQYSPVTVYQPAIEAAELDTTSLTGGIAVPGVMDPGEFYGVWVAPDLLGNGQEYYVQVECFGAGGGGGGGNATIGGGGGGGGGYSCESNYPIVPGNSYAYVIGLPGTGGLNTPTDPGAFSVPGSAGTQGGNTVFDTAGLGLAGGVVANGGMGGDMTSVGIGAPGGAASSNTIAYAGGAGGTNGSGNGGDNALYLAQTRGCFAGNSLSTGIIDAWYILNDGPDSSFEFNDWSENANTASCTDYTGGVQNRSTACPAPVPAYTTPANPPFQPNPATAGVAPYFKLGRLTAASGVIRCPVFGYAGTAETISCWIQADPSGTWGNTAAGSIATIAANSKNYATGGAFTGYGLYLANKGSASSPAWYLYFAVGNDSTASIRVAMPPTPGTWYYVVATFDSGAMALYVNGSEVATGSAGFSSLQGSSYPTAIGLSPAATANWFFGYLSNIWFAHDVATTTLMSNVLGTTPPTGGAGGGSSGGPSANGNPGATAVASVGGDGGSPVIQPAALEYVTTPSSGGFNGANAGSGDQSPSTPGGGVCGGGGGGSGNISAGSPDIIVLTVPFASAATYNGVDATGGAGSLYNVNQQSNPASGLNSVLYAGGLPTDAATGSKNSLLLLPPSLAGQLNDGAWLISQVFLTFTNAYPTNTVESILEVYWSADTSLPQTYLASDYNGVVGGFPIPVGAGTLTYDITDSGLAAFGGERFAEGAASAFIIGTTNDPTFDAYNATTGPQYYSAIYGPGAMDQFGNSQEPYLTLILAKTTYGQLGSNASGGGIVISYVNEEDLPVAMVQPFAGTDPAGNEFAEGFTGPISAWNPAESTPGSYAPEEPHDASGLNSFITSPSGYPGLQYWLDACGLVHLSGCIQNPSSGGPPNTTFTTLPASYWPLSERYVVGSVVTGSTAAFANISIDTAGNLQLHGINSYGETLAASTIIEIEASYPSRYITGTH